MEINQEQQRREIEQKLKLTAALPCTTPLKCLFFISMIFCTARWWSFNKFFSCLLHSSTCPSRTSQSVCSWSDTLSSSSSEKCCELAPNMDRSLQKKRSKKLLRNRKYTFIPAGTSGDVLHQTATARSNVRPHSQVVLGGRWLRLRGCTNVCQGLLHVQYLCGVTDMKNNVEWRNLVSLIMRFTNYDSDGYLLFRIESQVLQNLPELFHTKVDALDLFPRAGENCLAFWRHEVLEMKTRRKDGMIFREHKGLWFLDYGYEYCLTFLVCSFCDSFETHFSCRLYHYTVYFGNVKSKACKRRCYSQAHSTSL